MDVDDLTGLYDARAREVLAFLMHRTGDPQLALDLLGDTFLTAFEQRGRCRARHERGRTAWLFRIAANRLVDHYRRTGRERRAIERMADELRPATEDERGAIERLTETEERGSHVREAFLALRADQREAVRLRVLQEHPYPELAQELGITEPAARRLTSRAANNVVVFTIPPRTVHPATPNEVIRRAASGQTLSVSGHA